MFDLRSAHGIFRLGLSLLFELQTACGADIPRPILSRLPSSGPILFPSPALFATNPIAYATAIRTARSTAADAILRHGSSNDVEKLHIEVLKALSRVQVPKDVESNCFPPAVLVELTRESFSEIDSSCGAEALWYLAAIMGNCRRGIIPGYIRSEDVFPSGRFPPPNARELERIYKRRSDNAFQQRIRSEDARLNTMLFAGARLYYSNDVAETIRSNALCRLSRRARLTVREHDALIRGDRLPPRNPFPILTERSPSSDQNRSFASPSLLKTIVDGVLSDVSAGSIKQAFAQLDQLTFESRESALEAQLSLLVQILATTDIDFSATGSRVCKQPLAHDQLIRNEDESISNILIDQVEFLIAQTLVRFNGDLDELRNAARRCGAKGPFLVFLDRIVAEYTSVIKTDSP